MPVQALMQLWREIMMATLSVVEQPFSCGYLGGGALGIEGGQIAACWRAIILAFACR
jgi:hypothetical protein